jgi:acetolactate synthase-1/3 small subunit
MKYTLSILVENQTGVLTRITSLFARRGYNIESLAVGAAEQANISRVTIVLPGTPHSISQIIKQVYKIVEIVKVENITDTPSIERELMLIKINTLGGNRREILEIANIFRARIVDFTLDCLMLEITGEPREIVVIERSLRKFGVIEIARTGIISLTRPSNINYESSKALKQPVVGL